LVNPVTKVNEINIAGHSKLMGCLYTFHSTKPLYYLQKKSKENGIGSRIHIYRIKKQGGGKMNDFSRLVSEQMITMDKMLYLQGELERCQKIEEELHCLQKETEVESIQFEISRMKKELYEIQRMFDKQTEEVIQSYRQMEITSCL
jgi:hypothetical protein